MTTMNQLHFDTAEYDMHCPECGSEIVDARNGCRDCGAIDELEDPKSHIPQDDYDADNDSDIIIAEARDAVFLD